RSRKKAPPLFSDDVHRHRLRCPRQSQRPTSPRPPTPVLTSSAHRAASEGRVMLRAVGAAASAAYFLRTLTSGPTRRRLGGDEEGDEAPRSEATRGAAGTANPGPQQARPSLSEGSPGPRRGRSWRSERRPPAA